MVQLRKTRVSTVQVTEIMVKLELDDEKDLLTTGNKLSMHKVSIPMSREKKLTNFIAESTNYTSRVFHKISLQN